MTDLETPLKNAVGGRTATPLANHLGLHTVGDLVHHYPRRYARRGELSSLADLRAGEHVTVMAEVRKVNGRRMKERPGHVLEVEVTDGTGRLYLTFFNQKWRADRDLLVGRRGLFAGQVSVFKGRRQLTHPDYEMVGDGADAGAYAGALIPIYPAATKYASWQIANAVRIVLATLQPPEDPIPVEVRARHGLLPLAEALQKIHLPGSYDDVRRATERLKWDEALTLQVSLARRRAASRRQRAAAREVRDDGLLAAFDARLPFALTAGQQDVGQEIFTDLAQPHPMHRLLQGEVGAGKTVVALRAMLTVVDGGGQAALLAPTEVLAQQHARSIRDLLGPLAMAGELGAAEVATRVALLTGSQGAAARRATLDEVADGTAGIAVGTHALLQEGVDFHDLGLVVIDEQHRFGVEQRDALRAKSSTPPHVLVMTATPIPRTVAMTVYGDLETSALTQLPQGRSEIQTTVVPVAEKPAWLDRVWERVREEAEAGRQVFVVCPRIGEAPSTDDAEAPDDPGEDDGPQRPTAAVTEVLPMLVDGPLTGLRVDALHGRLAPETKDDVMRRFASGDLDVLVATTVIEVGVDVPNATVMVVLDADRFGVSQLHQLRGRVGRGSHPGLCLLVTGAAPASPARTRLEHVAATCDGFELARLDLQQRREGDVLGAMQHGRRSSLKLLALLEDEDLIRAARDEASALVDADPDLTDHPALAAAVERLVDADRAEYLEKT